MTIFKDDPLWFLKEPDRQKPQHLQAALKLIEMLDQYEADIFLDTLEFTRGSLSEDEIYAIGKNSTTTVYTHIKGCEKRYFYDWKFVVGFSERWINDEMVVSVQRPDGNNALFTLSLRDYYER